MLGNGHRRYPFTPHFSFTDYCIFTDRCHGEIYGGSTPFNEQIYSSSSRFGLTWYCRPPPPNPVALQHLCRRNAIQLTRSSASLCHLARHAHSLRPGQVINLYSGDRCATPSSLISLKRDKRCESQGHKYQPRGVDELLLLQDSTSSSNVLAQIYP